MNLAVFYPDSIFSAWSISRGLADEFRRMGHEVIEYGIFINPKLPLPTTGFPTFDDLNGVDRIIVSGPEHVYKKLRALYPQWNQLRPRIVGWLHETIRREDYGTLPVDELKDLCHFLFTPAHQDQEYGFTWLPFGVDTHVFHGEVNFPREHGVTFIGFMYPKRHEALQKWGIDPRFVRVEVKGPEGILPRETANLYAEELRSIRILLNLPSLCDHVVTKIFEAMACGCAVVTPINTTTIGKDNYDLFQNNVHLLYYEDNPAESLAMLEDEVFRKAVALEGQREVLAKHSMRARCEKLLEA